jgi:hypothetical protein
LAYEKGSYKKFVPKGVVNLKAAQKIKNRHMIHGNKYWEDLANTVTRFENALKDINEKCVYADKQSQILNPDEIGEIVMKALDI